MDIGYGISIWLSTVCAYIDMVILDIDVEYGLMMWEMKVSIWSFCKSIWDILSLWSCRNIIRDGMRI